MTLEELVKKKLHEMMLEIADWIELDEHEAAGVPMALFQAEQVMRSAFEKFVEEQEE